MKLYSPRELAELLQVTEIVVLRWLRRGELKGSSVSYDPKSQRPRWRVSQEQLQEFLAARANVPAEPKGRRARKAADVPQYV